MFVFSFSYCFIPSYLIKKVPGQSEGKKCWTFALQVASDGQLFKKLFHVKDSPPFLR